jgi:hypothetical protein
MKNSKSYARTRFTEVVLREAIEMFRAKTNRGKPFSTLTMSVEIDDSKWYHDSFEEFFADYRKSDGSATYRENPGSNSGSLDIYIFRDLTTVEVCAPERDSIEAVFEIFRRHAACSRLPVPKPDRPTIFNDRCLEQTVFYAWQNDNPNQVNRFLIRDVLDGASRSIKNDLSVEDSPRLDYDTRGVSGTPEIASTIFSKIKRCAVFVADVTFVGASILTSPDRERKLLPNPNVMLELGFASATIGWDRIIAVMNEHYGSADQQIFDLKSRRFPIRFTADPVSPDGLDETKRQLRISVERAIRLALRSEYEAVEDIIGSLDSESMRQLRMCARWDRFWDAAGNSVSAQAAMDAANRHLLALKLIRVTWDSERQDYVHSWTYLGVRTLIRLGLRPE